MKKRIFEMELYGDILDIGLTRKIDFGKTHLPIPDSDVFYELLVEFSHECIKDQEKVMSLLASENLYESINDDERIHVALGKQLSNIERAFSAFGYDIVRSSINGEAFDNDNKIVIVVFRGDAKEFDRKGNLKKVLKARVVAPSAPYVREQGVKTLSEIVMQRIREGALDKELVYESTPQNGNTK